MMMPTWGSTTGRSRGRIAEHQVLRRLARPGAHGLEVLADGGHVTDLAARAELLAVEVDLDLGPVGEAVVDAFVDALGRDAVRAAEQVDHDDRGRHLVGGTERVVEDRPQ